MNVIQETAMTTSAYKSKRNDDTTITKHLIIRFTRQLKNRWNNYLKPIKKVFIYEKRNEFGEPMAVDTLIFAITKHFIINPSMF